MRPLRLLLLVCLAGCGQCGRDAPRPAPPAPPRPKTHDVDVRSTTPPRAHDLAADLTRYVRETDACFRQAEALPDPLVVTVEVRAERDGVISRADVRLPVRNDALTTCVRGAIMHRRFDAPVSGAPRTVSVQVTMTR